ncbi:MarR family transcriptional regulator [uncultured Pseudacidovorax sp.]|uniref:MarR family winged helix-turn-helix transcriptional regulator n=1 Tax=uncultured Pseudacidovorax sp. TaxID=679313 RepID=UPI0025EB0D05|nr:MarR family transcriptional regulator [uncultured Pseudacidovorax sp.]
MSRLTDAQAMRLGLALARAHARQQQRLDERLGMWHGLGVSDFLLLDALTQATHGRLPTLQLAQALHIAPSMLVRQLMPLEKTGLVAREIGTVLLRPAGRQLHAEAAQTVGAVCAKAWASVGLDLCGPDALQAQLDAVAGSAVIPTPSAAPAP